MTVKTILDILEEEFPTSKLVHIEGSSTSMWLHKLEIDVVLPLIDAIAKAGDDQSKQTVAAVELLAASLGDSSGPGLFDNDRGRKWLTLNPSAVVALAQEAIEFFELSGPSAPRKNDSASADGPDLSTTSHSSSDTPARDDSLESSPEKSS